MKTNGVLFVGNFLSSYGIGSPNPCEELAARFSHLGMNVFTASSRRQPVARLLDMLSTAYRCRRDYSVAVVDVFSGRAFYWAEACCWLLRRLNRPYVLALHGGNLPSFARRHPHRVRSLLQTGSAVTAPSDYLQQELDEFRRDILLVRNPIELDRYAFRPREGVAPSLVWLRAFHRMYNPCLAIDVLSRLRHGHPTASLWMVGPDKGDGTMAKVRAKAERLGVRSAFHLEPGVPKADVPQWLNRGDIFINTTGVDNSPVSVIEAMACGLCVVSTNVGGLRYLLRHEENALLVPSDDPEAMTAAVRRLIADRDLASRLSRAAREFSRQFDWTAIRPRWEQLLMSVRRSQVSNGSAE